jgi:hypothetical protein
MDLAVAAPGGAARADRVREVRAWWRTQRPGPTIGQRLDLLYTVAITTAILGALVYGTASSALAQVVTPAWLARFGPPLALAAMLLVARWGAYQGPVVFSVADVAHLLGAPLSRRRLSARRLVRGLVSGAVAGALAGGVLIVGVAGEGRGLAPARGAGLVVGVAGLGTLAIAAAWWVERSARWERVTARAIGPVALVAAGLAVLAGAGHAGREIVLWCGPWGWAVQPGTDAGTTHWVAALACLTALTVGVAVAAVRGCGNCAAERHLRRAEARSAAVAALATFDARSARRALEDAGERRGGRVGADLRRLRRVAARGAGGAGTAAAIAWRDAVSAARTPGRPVEAAALTAAGVALGLTNADHAVTVLAAMLIVYGGAARMLGPMRAELDARSRAHVLLRPRIGQVVFAHAAVPALVAAGGAALGAAVCAIAGGLPADGGAAAVAAIAVTPVVTCCASLSARRGGRLPESVFMGSLAADPSGGGFGILLWLVWWPALAAGLAATPILLVSSSGAGAALIAAGAVLAVGFALATQLAADPDDT